MNDSTLMIHLYDRNRGRTTSTSTSTSTGTTVTSSRRRCRRSSSTTGSWEWSQVVLDVMVQLLILGFVVVVVAVVVVVSTQTTMEPTMMITTMTVTAFQFQPLLPAPPHVSIRTTRRNRNRRNIQNHLVCHEKIQWRQQHRRGNINDGSCIIQYDGTNPLILLQSSSSSSSSSESPNDTVSQIPPPPPPVDVPSSTTITTSTTTTIIDPFLPYMRDIERVLKNHAQIQRQQQPQQQQPPQNVRNNNDNDDDDALKSSSVSSLYEPTMTIINEKKESKKNNNINNYSMNVAFYTWCNEQRRNKPSLLLYDIDGAEKCIQMIRHLQQQPQPHSSSISTASPGSSRSSTSNSSNQQQSSPQQSSPQQMYIPEYAYITIMELVLQQRGRGRWKRNPNYYYYYHHSFPNENSSSASSSSSTGTGTSQSSNNNNNNNNNGIIICAADQLEELLNEYESQRHPTTTTITTTSPNHNTSIRMYNLVLEAYAVCATPRGDRLYAQRAQSLLRRMEEQQVQVQLQSQQNEHMINNNNNSNNNNALNTTTATTTTTTNDIGTAQSKQTYVLPVESYLHVLHAFAWQQGNLQSPVHGADVAYELLHIVKACTDDVRIIMQATIWVLEAYSKSMNGAMQCNQLLHQVQEYNRTSSTTSTTTDTSTIIQQLFDAEVYSNAILAWSKAAAAATSTPMTETGTKTASVLDRTTEDDDDDDDDTDDDIIGIVDSPSPISRTGTTNNNNHNDLIEQAAKNAHTLLLELVDHYLNGSFKNGSEPPLIAFNGVISAYSRLGQIDQAEDVLWLMERQVRPKCTHLIPDAISYNSILHGIYRQSQQQQQPQSKRNNKNLALQRALSILSYMEDNSIEQPAIRPNAFSYQTIMKCWLQCSSDNNGYSKEHIAEQAEQLLYKVEQLWGQGDTSFEYTNRIYNMLLNSFAKTYNGKRFLSNKAMDLLARMKQSTHQQCQPDIISYTSTLECIAQSSDPMASELADELLQEVKMRYETTNDVQLRPNLRTYTMTIQTLARNNGNIIRARELLTELVQRYDLSGYDPELKPNTYPYNYVLNCAANTMDPDQRLMAFQIATQTYQEMRQSKILFPDSFSYAFWLKCCNNLLDPGPLRSKAIQYAFEECKRDGLVSNEVLTRLLQGCPKEVVNTLLELQPRTQQSTTTEQQQATTAAMMTNTNVGAVTSSTIMTTGPSTQPPVALNIDENNNFIQRRRNNNINNTPQYGNEPFTSSSSFRPIARATFVSSTNTINNNNNNNFRITGSNNGSSNNSNHNNNLTIRDLPPSWSRNTILRSKRV